MQLHAAIDEFVLYIEIEKNYSENTVTSYEYDLQLFLTFLTDHGCSTCLNEITKTPVRRFIQYLLGSLKQKPRSVNRKISSLKSFTKYCLKEQYLSNDFTHGIESPKTDDKLPVYMTLTDLKQLFDYLERSQSRFSMRNELMNEKPPNLNCWRSFNRRSFVKIFISVKTRLGVPVRSLFYFSFKCSILFFNFPTPTKYAI